MEGSNNENIQFSYITYLVTYVMLAFVAGMLHYAAIGFSALFHFEISTHVNWMILQCLMAVPFALYIVAGWITAHLEGTQHQQVTATLVGLLGIGIIFASTYLCHREVHAGATQISLYWTPIVSEAIVASVYFWTMAEIIPAQNRRNKEA